MLSLALRFVIYVSRVSCLSAPKGRVVPASRATGLGSAPLCFEIQNAASVTGREIQ